MSVTCLQNEFNDTPDMGTSPAAILRSMRLAQANARTARKATPTNTADTLRIRPLPVPQPRVTEDTQPVSAAGEHLDRAFFAAIEEDLAEIRGRKAPIPVMPAVSMPAPAPVSAPMLQLADPIHAQMRHARQSIRGMWVGMGLLIVAMLVGVVWTTVRLDRADSLIATLLQQLDTERTLASTYKQETVRLNTTLTDSRVQISKLKAQVSRDSQTKTAALASGR